MKTYPDECYSETGPTTNKGRIAVMQAFEDGLEVQIHIDGKWLPEPNSSFCWGDYDYRIHPKHKPVPKPTYIPWTFETCPREGWVRLQGSHGDHIYRINSIRKEGLPFAYAVTAYDIVSRTWEYSLDGLTNWRPAGQEVVS